MYSVKEAFYTMQGEGAQAGRVAVFMRFAGCNLWTGREEDRYKAVCQFCDTDFVGTDGENGGKFKEPQDVAQMILRLWDEGHKNGVGYPLVVITGGEPLLQLDKALIDAIHDVRIEIAVESNGTIEAPEGIDWLCISPKANAPLKQLKGDELKLVFPQDLNEPDDFIDLEFDHFFLQPKDEAGTDYVPETIRYCLDNPAWRLSLQTHKIVGIK